MSVSCTFPIISDTTYATVKSVIDQVQHETIDPTDRKHADEKIRFDEIQIKFQNDQLTLIAASSPSMQAMWKVFPDLPGTAMVGSMNGAKDSSFPVDYNKYTTSGFSEIEHWTLAHLTGGFINASKQHTFSINFMGRNSVIVQQGLFTTG